MKIKDVVELISVCDLNSTNGDKYNPYNITGRVVSVTGRYLPIIVLWDNGIKNSYYEKNLKKLNK